MRSFFALTCAFLFASSARAQLPPVGPQRDKLRDQVLQQWETAMSQVKSLEAKVERTNEDKVFQAKVVFKGTVKYLAADPATKSPRCASLYLVNAANAASVEYFILNGAKLYDVSFASKEIRELDWTQLLGKGVDANDFLMGMSAAKAKATFDIDLIPAKTAAQDQFYWTLCFSPKAKAKQDFTKAWVVLVKNTNLPRAITLQQLNGNTSIWDLPIVDTTVRLSPNDFQPPGLKDGWKYSKAPAP